MFSVQPLRRVLAALVPVVAVATVLASPVLASQRPEPVGEPRSVSSTAYCLRGTMASGAYTYDGAVAMNHVAFGTKFQIQSGPLAGKIVTVEDRIGHGSEFDIWFPSCSAAYGYGHHQITIQAVQMVDDVYTDIADSPHAEAIRTLAGEAVVDGYGDGSFRPDYAVTRGQMATFLTRALELTAQAKASAGYVDTAGHVHEPSIVAVSEAEIAGGYADDTYRPEHAVTRGQMAAFLVRALGLSSSGGAPEYSDIAGHAHEEAIRAVTEAGVTTGFDDGTFRPDHAVTRGQMATFIVRALGM